MADMNDLPGNIEDIVRRSLEKRRKRGESVSPTWGMDLSRPESQEDVTPEWGMDLSPVAEASRKAAAGEESPDWGLDVSPLAQAIGATKQGKDVPGWGMDLSATSPEEVSDTWGLDLSPGSEDRKRLKSASARAAAGEDVPGWGYEYEPEAPEEPVGSLMGERITMDEPVIRRTASIPQRVGQTAAGEPITMDEPRIRRTQTETADIRPSRDFGGPTRQTGEMRSGDKAPNVLLGSPKIFGVGSHYLPDAEQRAAEAANAPPPADASRAEKRRYLIETMGIPPGFQFEDLPEGQPWADIIRQDPTILEPEGGELPPGFKRDGNRVTGPSGAYTELGTPRILRKGSAESIAAKEQAPSTRQEVAGASPATNSDGPDVSGIYKQATLDELENVGRSLRGEAPLRVAPGMQAREEIKSWLDKKRAAEARAGEMDRLERLKMMEMLMRRGDAEAKAGQLAGRESRASAESAQRIKESEARIKAMEARAAAQGRRGETKAPRLSKAQENAAARLGEKYKSQMTEVEDRAANIDNALKKLDAYIDKYGPFEVMDIEGNRLMKGVLNDFAVDMAKLRDKESVARPSEVAEERSNLFEPGSFDAMRMSAKQAKDIVAEARNKVKERRAYAYKVRNIPMPEELGSPIPSPRGEAGPEAAADGKVRIRRKSDGSVSVVNKDVAQRLLKNKPDAYEAL